MSTQLGQQLRAFRQERRLSQQALAGQLGVGIATVVRWESGKTEPSGLAWIELARLGFNRS